MEDLGKVGLPQASHRPETLLYREPVWEPLYEATVPGNDPLSQIRCQLLLGAAPDILLRF